MSPPGGDGDRPAAPSPKVTHLPPGGPTRQLRRTGVKIGRRVLEYERPLLKLGPLLVVRRRVGGIAVRWIRRRDRR